MEEDLMPMGEQRLMEAGAKVQKLVESIVPNPADGLGISAMLLVNYLAAGLAGGALKEEFIDVIMKLIRDNVEETRNAILQDMVESTGSETIQ
jgi:ferritin-like protein